MLMATKEGGGEILVPLLQHASGPVKYHPQTCNYAGFKKCFPRWNVPLDRGK